MPELTGPPKVMNQHTWRLLCSSFLGSISVFLIGKRVITKNELHRSLQVMDPRPKGRGLQTMILGTVEVQAD